MREFLAFDDVLLQPRYSGVAPGEADISTALSRGFPLPLPLLSAAMDTVTESKMAIAIAQSGGLGVVHKNLTPHEQAAEGKHCAPILSPMRRCDSILFCGNGVILLCH